MIDLPSEERPSKSQRKREMHSLQQLGVELLSLSPSQLEKLTLDETLLQAIKHAQSLTSHLAKRRQLQYIGRLMREVDPAPIEQALEKIKLKHNQTKILFHQTERWRDQLIAEGDAKISELLTQYPEVDRQHLRQLVRNAQQGKSGADTELFRYLRQLIESSLK